MEDENIVTTEQRKDVVDKQTLYNTLVENIKSYMPDADFDFLYKAYVTADKLHNGQKRRSGEEYIIHPLNVAIILSKLHMDLETIIAGLLHDTIEDTGYKLEDLEKDFSVDIGKLVSGVTKLTELSLVNDKVEQQAENLRHMFLAMSKDIRVIIVKLADRLHNLRTLEYQTREKQKEKSLETLEIYSPIANRLGISRIKTEMDDLSLRYLKPKEYNELQKSIKVRKDSREKFINHVTTFVKEKMDEADIKVEVYGRVKNLFSIYKKMVNKKKSIDEIYDLFAIRILVNDVKDCYAALGIIHEYYTPIPGRFKDYIAMPKPNDYRSLHTTVFGKENIPFEIQIRTYEMHRVAEYGIAAHWLYKESGGSNKTENISELNQMNWLKDILEANREENNSKDFLDFVKSDLDVFTEKVFCFTPEGDVITLPYGSTPIDFAYMIHSAVGNKMVGAKVNEVLVPIDYVIQNGDRISIITSGNSNGPSRDWLKIVKSAQARSKILHWFKQEDREKNIAIGKEQVEKYIKFKKYKQEDLMKDEYIKEACKKYTCNNLEDLYATIGHGGLKESQFVSKLKEQYDKDHMEEITDEEIINSAKDTKVDSENNVKKGGIIVKGVKDLAVRYGKCCSPVPGDEIVGFVTRGRGITIHRTDCQNMMNLPEVEKGRIMPAQWEEDENKKNSYDVTIRIISNNRKGIIVDMTKVLNDNNVEITGLESRSIKNEKAITNIKLTIKNREEFEAIKNKIKNVQDVLEITRV